jgi:hypothetical protein
MAALAAACRRASGDFARDGLVDLGGEVVDGSTVIHAWAWST